MTTWAFSTRPNWTLGTAYYFVTHGLYQQAYTDVLVQDWQGYIEVFAALMPSWKSQRLAFKGLTALNRISIDGKWGGGKIVLHIHPNGAKKAEVKLSSVEGKLRLKGAKNRKEMEAGEKVMIEFVDNRSVTIFN